MNYLEEYECVFVIFSNRFYVNFNFSSKHLLQILNKYRKIGISTAVLINEKPHTPLT